MSIQAIGIFDDLSSDERYALAKFARRTSFAKGDEILCEGRHNASLFVVTEGLLQARLRIDGGDTLLARIEPGSFFGEISVFDPGPTTAQVHAVTDGTLLEIERDQLLTFVDQHPAAGAQLLLRLMREIARRVRRADDRLGDALLLNLLVGEAEPQIG